MATQPVGEASQQLWDETLSRLFNLSTSTVRRNTELESRVADLELELSVWKQAHAVAVEANERDTRVHNVQLAALNRQISNLDGFKNNNNALILCIINGDEFVFNRDLLHQGYQGGRTAAQRLTQAIAEQLAGEEIHVFGRLSFWITIYLNRSDLTEDIVGNGICTQEQFHDFLSGFTQASPRFSIIDVGNNKDALEAKIKEYIQIYAYFPQTLRIFFGGYDPVAYMSTLSALEKDQMLGKLVVLYTSHTHEGNNERPNVFTLPRMILDGLFLSEKLSRAPKKLAPLSTGPFSAVTTNGGLISPQSPPRPPGRPIDPSLPLHKQNPPPCNEFYLMTCSKGVGVCKYSHDYNLTSDQLVSLANNAKKAPCNWLKNGTINPLSVYS
ncbi:hypothetical protein JR316_0004925 [Psilocybe cubensis]|uniref:Uncharacterized protein n=2 Tax=Psilocybe cubensis TaxID=181762 RepID=A0ACB8H6M0_PSICU|nr:hypothetical protein JR316_0004925 [Psilocybe cubensis]KAH9482825.1 hypothetical protein JR316_0004925 [Psilocybe cubensis]